MAALFLIGQSVARYTSATVADLQVLQAVGMTRGRPSRRPRRGPFLAAVAGATLGVARCDRGLAVDADRRGVLS